MSTVTPTRLTREEYYRLGAAGHFDGRRVERIRGEIVEMSPLGWPHHLGKSLVVNALGAAFAGVAWVSDQGVLPTEDSDPQPDVAVIPGTLRAYTDHPTTALLVVEVSDSTLDYDLTVKAELYAEAGVPEYWVLDVNARVLHVLRDPAPLPAGLGATAYRTHTTLAAATASVTPLAAPAAVIPVADLLP